MKATDARGSDDGDTARWLVGAPDVAGATPNVAAWATALRVHGRSEFVKLAWPASKHEAWQHTPLKRIRALDVAVVQADAPPSQVERYLAEHPWDGSRLVFVNGHLAHTQLRDQDAQALRVVSLAHGLGDSPAPPVGTLSAETTQPFAALNSAHLQEGAVVTIAAEQALSAPLQLLFLSVPQTRAWMAHPRIVIVAQERACATLFEQHVCLGEVREQHLVNAVTECHIAEGAKLDYTILQDTDRAAMHVSQWMAHVAQHATARCAAVHLGGAWVRQEMHVQLGGEQATCQLTGLSLARGEQHMDTQVTVDHQATHGVSSQLFKSLLDDQATSVFSGKVLVRQHAIKTSAQQMSRNLLLSKQATAHTRPQLEILADDVRCTHGATVGQLQEEAVFYLRSRGLDEATTRRLLTYANACEALNAIEHPHLHALCDSRVRSELALDDMASTLGETP